MVLCDHGFITTNIIFTGVHNNTKKIYKTMICSFTSTLVYSFTVHSMESRTNGKRALIKTVSYRLEEQCNTTTTNIYCFLKVDYHGKVVLPLTQMKHFSTI